MTEISLPRGLTLMSNEKPLWYGRLSWAAEWKLILIGILTIWFAFVGLIFIIYAALEVYSTEYFVSNKRIYLSHGVVARQIMEIKNEWLIRTSMTQDVPGRLLDYGTVIINTPKQYFGEVVMPGVSDPQHMLEIVESIKGSESMPKLQIYSGPES